VGAAQACQQALLDAQAEARIAPILYQALEPFYDQNPIKLEKGFFFAEVPHVEGAFVVYHPVENKPAPLMIFRSQAACSLVPIDHLSVFSSLQHAIHQNALISQLKRGGAKELGLQYEKKSITWEDSPYTVDGRNETLRIPVFPTVFPPITPYTRNMLEVALETALPGERVLVMGCGSGVEAIALAKHRKVRVDCVDLNPLAVATAQAAARVYGFEKVISVWQSDLFSLVREKYHRIYFDSPLAVPHAMDLGDRNLSDSDGILLSRFLREVADHLRPAGRAYLMSWPNISGVTPPPLQTRKRRVFTDHSGVALAIHEVGDLSP
jgi:SAM-dependent methyltransferase